LQLREELLEVRLQRRVQPLQHGQHLRQWIGPLQPLADSVQRLSQHLRVGIASR